MGTTCQVAAGTAWLWARPDAFQSVDVLFIDEAAQMSLANVLAVFQAADTIVLIGDPRQLEQPTQGTHPEGTGVSALDHISGGHATIPADRGLFLEETWRLHPEICAFTSELFYESRLRPRPGLELQTITSSGRINGSGLRFMPVIHEGNQSSCPEEADSIRKLVSEILGSGARWTSREGIEAPIGLDDILIIAPYNAQVFELQERIPGARIGTVDKFQGQEAPIVIYSMTTSSHADAPRGMEFLYFRCFRGPIFVRPKQRSKCTHCLICVDRYRALSIFPTVKWAMPWLSISSRQRPGPSTSWIAAIARIFRNRWVRPAGDPRPVLLPELPIAGEGKPELRDIGAGLFEREGELAKVDGQLLSRRRIVRRLLSLFVGALQEEGGGGLLAEHIELKSSKMAAEIRQPTLQSGGSAVRPDAASGRTQRLRVTGGFRVPPKRGHNQQERGP
jgi:AAA domain